MKADKWIPFFALWVLSVSSNGEGVCKKHKVSALLGSSVVLPCNFSSDDSSWVEWTQEDRQNVNLVRLSSKGRILYLDPRSGRVKTFPIQASERKYSIIIDELQKSDIGSYYCKQSNECIEVKLSGSCKTQEIRSPLGSSVVLPCNFSSNDFDWVNWTQAKEDGQNVDLVHLSSKGRILYLDPRSGRVKTFPIQASKRNYSITIDELQNSDMGSYYCEQSNECFEVKLSKEKGEKGNLYLLIFICAGAAALILLSLFGYFCYLKCICLSNKSRPDDVIVTVSGTAGPSAPPQEGSVNELPAGVNNLDNNLVYENDDQYLNPSRNSSDQPGAAQHQVGNQPGQSGIGIYPNLEEFRFQREESQRTKQRFHLELFSRLRQASINRHFYANQGEIRKQQAMAAQAENSRAGMGRRKPKDSCEYKNPIYNRSTDQLNRL
ncbi:PREDICTED: uncharacterized protein LOC106932098 isoform X1 [Poecilia mexicana]|uniref:uncharacterized protein LOC106932098 isoform X1 n=1 Tax=Poecilia mexicana TaxID=48701 RepID=UPI00072E61D3|nr:PREDICTED: uncharacterized protein LOC106932098 isoform X1 [Poecilia mexicana]